MNINPFSPDRKPPVTEADLNARKPVRLICNNGLNLKPAAILLSKEYPSIGQDQALFDLGGRSSVAFLRAEYTVVPKAEQNEEGGSDIYGVVYPAAFEYLIAAPGSALFTVIQEWGNWADLPLHLRELEKANRPSAETLGYSREDYIEILGLVDGDGESDPRH